MGSNQSFIAVLVSTSVQVWSVIAGIWSNLKLNWRFSKSYFSCCSIAWNIFFPTWDKPFVESVFCQTSVKYHSLKRNWRSTDCSDESRNVSRCEKNQTFAAECDSWILLAPCVTTLNEIISTRQRRMCRRQADPKFVCHVVVDGTLPASANCLQLFVTTWWKKFLISNWIQISVEHLL